MRKFTFMHIFRHTPTCPALINSTLRQRSVQIKFIGKKYITTNGAQSVPIGMDANWLLVDSPDTQKIEHLGSL